MRVRLPELHRSTPLPLFTHKYAQPSLVAMNATGVARLAVT
jgi:hypothetical protein